MQSGAYGLLVAAGGLTKVQQEKLVGEGLAIGTIAAGLTEVPNTAMFELAFRRAWRSWAHARHFPQVDPDRIRQIMRASTRRTGVVLAEWEVDRTWRPRLRQEWELDEFIDALSERADVPGHAWVELAELTHRAVTHSLP